MKISNGEQDMRLLMLTGLAAVLVMSVQFLIRPALARGRELEKAVGTAFRVYTEQQEIIQNLADLDGDIEKQRDALEQAAGPYASPLTSWEMDKMITRLALRHGLKLTSLSLTEAAPGMAAPYSPMPDGGPAGGETYTDEPPPAGVLMAGVRLKANAETEQWKSFLDDIAWNYPGVQMVRFNISERAAGTGEMETACQFECELAVYMCGKETVT